MKWDGEGCVEMGRWHSAVCPFRPPDSVPAEVFSNMATTFACRRSSIVQITVVKITVVKIIVE